MTVDGRGNPLKEGARVQAWYDGVAYTATVKTIEPHIPGCEGHRHLVLTREDDQTEVGSCSDSVVVLT